MVATTWNSLDKSANVTLTGGSLIATTTSATLGSVRATTSVLAGKIYIEAIILVSGGSWYFGFANATASLAAIAGSNLNGVSAVPFSSIASFFNAISTGSNAAGTTLTTVRIAFDVTGQIFWSAFGSGPWNGSASANPGTGVGGRSVSTIAAGPYFPIFGTNASGSSCIVNFGATSFGYPIPTGFLGLDVNAQAFNASSDFKGYTVLAPPQSAGSVSKVIGYAILTESPITGNRFLREYPNPVLPRRLPDYTWIRFAQPSTIPPTPPLAQSTLPFRIDLPKRLPEYPFVQNTLRDSPLPPGIILLSDVIRRGQQTYQFVQFTPQDVILPPGVILLSDIIRRSTPLFGRFSFGEPTALQNTLPPGKISFYLPKQRFLNQQVYEQQFVPLQIYIRNARAWLFST